MIQGRGAEWRSGTIMTKKGGWRVGRWLCGPLSRLERVKSQLEMGGVEETTEAFDQVRVYARGA